MTEKPLPQPEPDAWERFERAIDAARTTAAKPKPKAESKPSKKARG